MPTIRLMKDADIIAESEKGMDVDPNDGNAVLSAAKKLLGTVEQENSVKEKYNRYQVVFPNLIIWERYKGTTHVYRK